MHNRCGGVNNKCSSFLVLSLKNILTGGGCSRRASRITPHLTLHLNFHVLTHTVPLYGVHVPSVPSSCRVGTTGPHRVPGSINSGSAVRLPCRGNSYRKSLTLGQNEAYISFQVLFHMHLTCSGLPISGHSLPISMIRDGMTFDAFHFNVRLIPHPALRKS